MPRRWRRNSAGNASKQGIDAIADRRSVLQIRADAERPVRLERRLHQQPRHAGCLGRTHPGRGPGVRRRRRSRCRIACWRSGRPMRRAAFPIRRTSARCRIRRSGGSAAAAPIRTATMRSTPSSRARCPIPTASRRRRISCSRSSRAACCCISIRRIYFDGEAANAADPVLALVPAERRVTLIATREGAGNAVYRFDIRLQGDNETVFFDAFESTRRACHAA